MVSLLLYFHHNFDNFLIIVILYTFIFHNRDKKTAILRHKNDLFYNTQIFVCKNDSGWLIPFSSIRLT